MEEHSELLKATYHTLGCKLNFAETSAIRKNLESQAIFSALPHELPDLCIVNTCSVTATADKKAKHLIRSLARRYPEAAIVVTGCYAQLKPEEAAALPGVEIVVGAPQKNLLPQIIADWRKNRVKKIEAAPAKDINTFTPSCERGERTRFFLKVQDGCNYYCTYCTIPYARGHSRSGRIDEMVALAGDAVRRGGKEIVITGVNVGEFGKDHDETFFDLIRRLDEVRGIERFRISSIEPNLLTEEIIRWIATDSRAFMPHFHIPLQSGSDKVLSLMKRRYDTKLFASRIEIIRELIPEAFIGVDIIAGARGETPAEWERSLEFANNLDITKFHVFPYSERPGTRALQLGDIVTTEEKHRRVKILTDLSDKKLNKFMQSAQGKEANVLWETCSEGRMTGHTENFLPVEAPLKEDLLQDISRVRLTEIDPKNPDIIMGVHLER